LFGVAGLTVFEFGTVRSAVIHERAVSPPKRRLNAARTTGPAAFLRLSSDPRRALAMVAGITEAMSLRRKR